MLQHNKRLNRKRLAGVGLVEIMVALVIGMFGVLVMMQVLSVTEEQKRTTTSGNDAMNEGIMALNAVQTDVRMAGYGIVDSKLLGCPLQLRAGLTIDPLAPVVINSANITGQDANTDTLLVFYGTTTGSPQGENIVNSTNSVQTWESFSLNDLVVAGPASVIPTGPCAGTLTLEKITGIDTTTRKITLESAAVLPVNGTLFNLGQSIRVVGYAVRNGNLAMCDFITSTCANAVDWVPIVNNIVSLRAQYGRDATAETIPPAAPVIVAPATSAMDGVVDAYSHTVPTTVTLPKKTVACGWMRTSAVRFALVARSAQPAAREEGGGTGEITTLAPVWEGSYDAAGNADRPIVLTGFADWKQYRYRVFQTVVPIRNVNWKGMVPQC